MKNNIYIVGLGNYNSHTQVKFQEVLKLTKEDSFLHFLKLAFAVQIELLDTKVLDFTKIGIDDLIVDAYCGGFFSFAMYLNSIKSTKKFGFITIINTKTNIKRKEQAMLVLDMFKRGGFKIKNKDKNFLLRSSMKFLNNNEFETIEVINETSFRNYIPNISREKLYENGF